MHPSAMENGRRFFETYTRNIESLRVLDVGSQNVNGSLRDVCPQRAKYVGADFEAGKDVDVVLEDPYKLPFSDNSFSTVISSSCFEHSEMFWLIHLEILRVLEPAGVFYLNAPFVSKYHRYPVDCWRFYPDCGIALANWGRRQGFKCAVLESYISNPDLSGRGASNDFMQDFVCVFVQDERNANQYPDRIFDASLGFSNGLVRDKEGKINRVSCTA